MGSHNEFFLTPFTKIRCMYLDGCMGVHEANKSNVFKDR